MELLLLLFSLRHLFNLKKEFNIKINKKIIYSFGNYS